MGKVVLLLLLLAGSAWANPADQFGLGAPSMGRGASGLLLDHDGFAAWRNPAMLGFAPFGELNVGLHAGTLRFDCFAPSESADSCPQVILWDGNSDGLINEDNPFDRWHPGADDYKAPNHLRIGAVIPYKDRLRVGLSLTLPMNRIVLIQQEDPYLPHYARWRNRPHRLSLHLAGSVKIVEGLTVGLGVSVLARAKLSLGFRIEARATDEELGENPPDGTDLGDLQVDFVVNPWKIDVDVRPHLAPVASIAWDLGNLTEALKGLRLGLVYRHPIDILIDPTELSLDLYGVVDDVGELGDVLIPLQAQVAFSILDFSTPRQVAVGVAWDRPELALSVDVTWNQWSAILPNVAQIDEAETDIAIGLVDIDARVVNARLLGDLDFRDTATIRIGGEARPPPIRLTGPLRAFGELGVILRAGYGYEPAFTPEQTALTNFLDNDTHLVSGGLGLWTNPPLGLLRGPISLDLFVQAQILEPRTHTKNEAWAQDGAPAGWPTTGTIESGGWVLLGGGDLTLRF